MTDKDDILILVLVNIVPQPFNIVIQAGAGLSLGVTGEGNGL